MSVGIPGIGIGALFYVISALLMVVLELYRTIRGRSSLARWRVVGHQAAIAACIILLMVVALWSLRLILPASAYLDMRVGNALGTGAGSGSGGPLVAAFLGTLVSLTLVFCFVRALPWVAGRPQSLPGSLRFGEGLAPQKQRAVPGSAHLDMRVGNALGTGAGSGRGAAGSNYRGHLMGSAALLVVTVGAVAFALILMQDNYAAISQVREPLISQAPSQVSRVGGVENARARPQQEDKEQSADGKSYNHRPEQYNGPLDADTRGGGGPVRTEHDTGAHFLAQGSRTATATQSAPSSAQNEPAAARSETASIPPPAEAPAQITATGVPVKGSGRSETGHISPGSQDGDHFDIQIRVGANDTARIAGNLVSDELALPGEHCERPPSCPVSEVSLQAAGWQERGARAKKQKRVASQLLPATITSAQRASAPAVSGLSKGGLSFQRAHSQTGN